MAQEGWSGNRWKKKYKELVQEQEQAEEHWQQQRENLQRGLAKVSVAAQGQDKTLDAALKILRKSLLKDTGETALAPHMDTLEAGIHAMDKSRVKRTLVAADSLSRLLQQLQDLAIDSSASRAINKLDRQLKKASGRASDPFDIEMWLEQVAAAQGTAFASLASSDFQSTDSSPSWFQRLTQSNNDVEQSNKDAEEAISAAGLTEGSNKPQVETTSVDKTEGQAQTTEQAESSSVVGAEVRSTDDEIESDNQPFDLDSVKDLQQKSQSEDGYDSIRVEVVAVLLALLADIEVPPDAQPIADQLYKDLQNGLEWAELLPALDNVVTVVTSALGRDQHEFEQFLQSLNQQLLEIASFISFVDNSQLIGEEQTRELTVTLGNQVGQIEASFSSFSGQSTQEVSELKRSVAGSLQSIVASLEQFQLEQNEQHKSMSEQLTEMSKRVEKMEEEARQANENLQKQREKLLRDTLTNLPNREAYNIRLQQEFDRWQRYQRPLVFAIADVDLFKRINDDYGHAAGDKVLKIIARTLQKQLRKTDFIARFGGEEFVMLLPETSLEAAELALEKLRAAVEACPFRFKDKPLTITSSFGATQFAEGDSIATAFDRADRALYKAKDAGRNGYKTLLKSDS